MDDTWGKNISFLGYPCGKLCTFLVALVEVTSSCPEFQHLAHSKENKQENLQIHLLP